MCRTLSGSLHAIATHTNGWQAWPPQSYFAALLDRAIARSGKAKQIEGTAIEQMNEEARAKPLGIGDRSGLGRC